MSDTFPLPSWQAAAGVGRADTRPAPRPGVACPTWPAAPTRRPATKCWWTGSRWWSADHAVAPLWAALVCRMAQSTGKPFGLLQPLVYAGLSAGTAAAGFQDITSGNDGAYAAGPGWDACTGLGSPDGTALLGILSAALASTPTS